MCVIINELFIWKQIREMSVTGRDTGFILLDIFAFVKVSF